MKYKLIKNKNEVGVKLFPVEVGHICDISTYKPPSGKLHYTFDFGGCDTPSKDLSHTTKCMLCVNNSIHDTDILERYFEKLK